HDCLRQQGHRHTHDVPFRLAMCLGSLAPLLLRSSHFRSMANRLAVHRRSCRRWSRLSGALADWTLGPQSPLASAPQHESEGRRSLRSAPSRPFLLQKLSSYHRHFKNHSSTISCRISKNCPVSLIRENLCQFFYRIRENPVARVSGLFEILVRSALG